MNIIDIIFPKRCVSCNTEGRHLCEDCFSLISIAHDVSPLSHSSLVDGLFAATSYQDVLIQKIIHNYKYQPFLRDLFLPLASLILAHLALLDKPYVFTNPHMQSPSQTNAYILIPMPLHKRRLRWRKRSLRKG